MTDDQADRLDALDARIAELRTSISAALAEHAKFMDELERLIAEMRQSR